MGGFGAEGADPVVTRAVEQDKVPWYKKPNLRHLYLLLFPACMYDKSLTSYRVEMTRSLCL